MDFLLSHGFEIAQLGVNLILMLWAFAKKADKALLFYVKSELSNSFMTKEDGRRMEATQRRILRLLKGRRHASPRRPPPTPGTQVQAD